MSEFIFKLVSPPEVLDGDTCKVRIDLGFHILTERSVRINNIDAPEIHSKNKIEKECGFKVKSLVEKWLQLNQDSVLISYALEGDKFGRVLGDFKSKTGDTLSNYLLINKLVRPYIGNKKKKWLVSEFNVIQSFPLIRSRSSGNKGGYW